jgi:hypothetical protein
VFTTLTDALIIQVPEITLAPMGAFLDLSVRRSQIAATDIFKGACRKPKRYNSHFICFPTFNAYGSVTIVFNKKFKNSSQRQTPKDQEYYEDSPGRNYWTPSHEKTELRQSWRAQGCCIENKKGNLRGS